MLEADDSFDPDSFDTCLNMGLAIDQAGGNVPDSARMTEQLHGCDSDPIDTADDDPVLDSRMHEVNFADGHKKAMAANAITEAAFASVNKEGPHRHLPLCSIDDTQHSKDAILKDDDAFVVSSNGAKRRKETRKG